MSAIADAGGRTSPLWVVPIARPAPARGDCRQPPTGRAPVAGGGSRGAATTAQTGGTRQTGCSHATGAAKRAVGARLPQRRLARGRRLRLRAMLDVCTREALAVEVDTSLPGDRVVRLLSRPMVDRGIPQEIVLDEGPELAGRAVDQGASERGVRLHFIKPGKPVQNAVIERFNGRLRDECPTSTGSAAWPTPAGSWRRGGRTTMASAPTAPWGIEPRRSGEQISTSTTATDPSSRGRS